MKELRRINKGSVNVGNFADSVASIQLGKAKMEKHIKSGSLFD